ncbi:MAG: Crp/Fnr family transcriptional regulator [Intestinibacillus sp.]
MNKHFAVLKTVPLFAGIAEQELGAVLDCLRCVEKQYDRQAWILRAGEPATAIGILVRGRAHIIREEFTGERTIVAELSPGEIFAEAFCCVREENDRRLPVSVVAAEESTALLLDYQKILVNGTGACGFHHQLIANMMNVLAQKNILLNRKIGHLSKRTTREKLLSYLSEQATLQTSRAFSIPFDRQALADYLCVDRSAMSAVLSKLQEEGVLQFHKNEFELL